MAFCYMLRLGLGRAAYVGHVGDMVWRFQNQTDRNAAGRALREQGFQCFGTGPTRLAESCLLTVTETTAPRRLAAAQLIRGMAGNHPPAAPLA